MIYKQTIDNELFPEIDWEMPQNRKQRGELLIVGGSPHGFASVANSYEYVADAGIGAARVLMPDATEQTVKDFIKNIDFLPSTPSGSFSKRGLSQLKQLSLDHWGTLLAGEFGRNSETASLIEGFLMSTSGNTTLTKDAVDYAISSYPRPVLNRENTLLVASLSQLQKLLKHAGATENIRFEMTLDQVAKFLENLSSEMNSMIITVHHKNTFVAVNGEVSHTSMPGDETLWQTKTAAYATVYWLQHQSKPFQAMTSAVFRVWK